MPDKNMNELIKQAKSAPKAKTVQKVTPINRKNEETQFSFYIENDLLKKLKYKALEDEKSIKSIINEALKIHLKVQ
jgi:hypothetical protein